MRGNNRGIGVRGGSLPPRRNAAGDRPVEPQHDDEMMARPFDVIIPPSNNAAVPNAMPMEQDEPVVRLENFEERGHHMVNYQGYAEQHPPPPQPDAQENQGDALVQPSNENGTSSLPSL